MAPSKPPPYYPPCQHVKTVTVAPAEAQALLASYMQLSERFPFLHPTALIGATGVRHGPNSGPSGGLVMHHLRRIEAGLRGESLTVETDEELRAQFGDEQKERAHRSIHAAEMNGDDDQVDLPEGDDGQLDALISGKKQKKASQGSKRKRTQQEISEWAEESSRAATPADDYEDLAEFEQSQEPLIGEVGERDTAFATQQNGTVPAVAHHSKDEQAMKSKRPKTNEEKAARKAAKKERNKKAKQKSSSAG